MSSTSTPSIPSTPATPSIVSFHNFPFITGVSQSPSLSNRPRTLKFFPKNGRVGTRLTVEVYLELPNFNNVVLNLAFGDLMVETHQVALPDSRFELIGIVPSQEHIKSANRSKVPVNVIICSDYNNIPIDKWHLGDFVFKAHRRHSSQGCLYHPYSVSNGVEQTSPTTSVTPPLKNEMLYVNENNSDVYGTQANSYDFYSYGNSVNSVTEQQKSSLNVSEQTFDLQNYREIEMISCESQSDVQSDPSSFYSSSASTPYSTASDDSFNDSTYNEKASLESPNLIYAQDPSNDTQIVPISSANYSDFSSTEDLPTPITVKSMNYQIATPNIPPGFCPFFPPSMYPYIGYPVIPSITLKESPMVPSSDRPPRPKNYNFNDSDCKTQLYELLNKVKLVIDGDIQSMAQNWSVKDFRNRRRLIQFIRRVEGDEIRVSFKPVKPDKRPKYGIFVSCIWWEAKDDYYITSVDCIYLLECLTGIRLTQDEKNRIRRNLEIFKPSTVGKKQKDSWNCVIYAINKILRKYMNSGPATIDNNLQSTN
ncbi:hypothetical protein C2G38_2048231 [Gigaspora rosea]|uniref:DUF7082 domain-containing protein n=1 Tax=Gigaspora rosea TaxID=44941 RepID=A0A397U6I9_9GLOM|nr:hypothetical protein C2G38_2048231 [Gigaspora rosea]